ERAQLTLDLALELGVAGLGVLIHELLQAALVGGDLVGDVEEALHLLAIEPVGQRDRVVLELGDQLAIAAGEAEAGAAHLAGIAGVAREAIEALALADRELVEAAAHGVERLGQALVGHAVVAVRRDQRAQLDDDLGGLLVQLVAAGEIVGVEGEPA